MNILLIIVLITKMGFIWSQSESVCQTNVYERCNHGHRFSARELEIARVWLQKRMLEADYKPRQSPCKKLLVSKDFKCLSARERTEFIRVIRILYENGVIGRLADIHDKYWSMIHKSAQSPVWHTWFIHVLEQEMRKVNPQITLPYYSSQIDSKHPHKSMIWNYMGTYGTSDDDYCVRDGIFSKLNLSRCVRRERKPNGSLPHLDGEELGTYFLQNSRNFAMIGFLEAGLHFNTHLAIGGYHGHMSVDSAAYDILFFLWHNHEHNVKIFKSQLSHRNNLTPKMYNLFPTVDQMTGQMRPANIERDRLFHFNIPVLDAFHIGFGQLCTIPDKIVIAINRKVNNETIVPTAVRRMSDELKAKFFPKFLSKTFDEFSHLFEEVGECNRECRPIPHFEPYVSTENGRRLLRRVSRDYIDLRPIFVLSQAFHLSIITTLNKHGYCSPYV